MSKRSITTAGETLHTYKQCGKQFFKSGNMPRGKCFHCGKRRLCDTDSKGECICAECKAQEDIAGINEAVTK